jgi:pyruvate formate lyase activating enzyme
MEIAGIEKLSLVDYPSEMCCVLFLNKCNFRCGFCYNPQLVLPEKANKPIDETKIFEFLESRKGKLSAVCITGGEPLLTLKEEFLKKIKDMGYLIKLDTNGSKPKKLKELLDKELIDYIAMDIKGPKELYREITNSDIDTQKIEESIKIISKLPEHEFRTTIIEKFHSRKNMESMIDWLKKIIGKEPRVLYFQGFKNTKNHLDPQFNKEKNTSENFIKELSKDYPFVKLR